MQCRLPVVASDVGGVSEAVINDETGILVSNDNMASVVLALKKLVLDKNIRVTMGELGRARYESLFTVEKMVSQTFAIYERAVEKNKT
jgi:glycosyltransferase involved in cell wall biosynthesis